MFGLRTNQSEIEKILLKASSLGINKIDTSPSYINGNSDKLLSRTLKKSPSIILRFIQKLEEHIDMNCQKINFI